MAAIIRVEKKDTTKVTRADCSQLSIADVLMEFRNGFNELADAINGISAQLSDVKKDISEGGDVIKSINYNAESVHKIENEVLPALREKIEISARKVKSDVLVVVNESKGKITELEGHSRRLNVIVNGLDYHDDENPEEVARNFLKNDVKIPSEEVDNFRFRDIHRLPKARNRDGTERADAKKPMILALLAQKDRNQIIGKAYELKGTPLSMKTDLPKELNEVRGRMLKERKRRLQANPDVKCRVIERSFKPVLQVADGLIPGTRKVKWVDIKEFP